MHSPRALALNTLTLALAAAPAMANAPYVVPAGLVETLNSMLEHILAWFGGGGPAEIVPSR